MGPENRCQTTQLRDQQGDETAGKRKWERKIGWGDQVVERGSETKRDVVIKAKWG